MQVGKTSKNQLELIILELIVFLRLKAENNLLCERIEKMWMNVGNRNAHKSNLIFDKNNDNKYHYTIVNILLLILICNK